MDYNQTYEEHSKSIILNDSDNIIIALDNMKAGQYLKNFDVIIDSPILSVHLYLQNKLLSTKLLCPLIFLLQKHLQP